jgi:hypothetical protein
MAQSSVHPFKAEFWRTVSAHLLLSRKEIVWVYICLVHSSFLVICATNSILNGVLLLGFGCRRLRRMWTISFGDGEHQYSVSKSRSIATGCERYQLHISTD